MGRGKIDTTKPASKRKKKLNPQTPNDGVGAPSGNDFEVVVGTGVNYAPHQEYGTKHIAARPFLRPAFRKVVGKYLKRLKEI